MCGIAGFMDFTRDSKTEQWKAVGAAMRDALAHRGPDDEGLWQGKHGVLAHRRLAVIDPENGRQPMERRLGAAAAGDRFLRLYR